MPKKTEYPPITAAPAFDLTPVAVGPGFEHLVPLACPMLDKIRDNP